MYKAKYEIKITHKTSKILQKFDKKTIFIYNSRFNLSENKGELNEFENNSVCFTIYK